MGKYKRKEPKKAVALKYDPLTENAPVVVASGKGFVAGKIVNEASGHGIPVYKDQAVADALEFAYPGQEIPVELYEAVAEIFVMIARIDEEYGGKYLNKDMK